MKVTHSLIVGMAFALSACASALTPEERAEIKSADLFEDDPRRGDEVKKICFVSNIDGFSNASDRAVVISEGRKDYLVTTSHRCSDLDHALSVGIKSFSSCLSRGDKLIGRDSLTGHNTVGAAPIACHVSKIYKWDAKAMEKPAEEADTAS